MTVYRVTMYMNDRGRGESETYWTPDQTVGALGPLLKQLVATRAGLLASEVTFDGVRIALYGSLRRSQLLVPGAGSDIWNEWGFTLALPFFGAGPTASDQAPYGSWGTSLQQNFGFDTNRKAVRYLAGVPRNIVLNPLGSTQIDAEGTWWNSLAVFDNFLTKNGFQLNAFVQPANPALYAVNSIGLTTGITDVWVGVPTATFPFTPAVGQRLRLQGWRPAKGTRAATVNGTWYCSGFNTVDIPGTTKIYLRNSSAVIPSLQRFTDKTLVLPTVKQPYPIAVINPMRVVTRKRGKAFLVPRGRRLTHVSLDP